MAKDGLNPPETASSEDGSVLLGRRGNVERRSGRRLSQRAGGTAPGGKENERNRNDDECSGEIGQGAFHVISLGAGSTY
jgi:hypothetical protein